LPLLSEEVVRKVLEEGIALKKKIYFGYLPAFKLLNLCFYEGVMFLALKSAVGSNVSLLDEIILMMFVLLGEFEF
jgi:hypothetical protein